MGAIIPYKDRSLEVISGSSLVTRELLVKELPRFFMSGSVYVGKYNQVGFVIIDRQPDERPYWIGSDIMRYTPKFVEEEIANFRSFGVGIPEEKRFFYDTRGGMAALRYFAISDNLMDVLKRDDFIGPAVIRKICEDNAVPDEFEELSVSVYPPRDSIPEYSHPSVEENGLKILVDSALGSLKQRTGSDYVSREYVTYFPTVAFSSVVPILEDSVKEVVARFDQLGDRWDILKNHRSLKANPLLIE